MESDRKEMRTAPTRKRAIPSLTAYFYSPCLSCPTMMECARPALVASLNVFCSSVNSIRIILEELFFTFKRGLPRSQSQGTRLRMKHSRCMPFHCPFSLPRIEPADNLSGSNPMPLKSTPVDKIPHKCGIPYNHPDL